MELVKIILSLMNKSNDLISFVSDRPGHDKRYSINNSKIKEVLGWEPKHNFNFALSETIKWYLNNLAFFNK